MRSHGELGWYFPTPTVSCFVCIFVCCCHFMLDCFWRGSMSCLLRQSLDARGKHSALPIFTSDILSLTSYTHNQHLFLSYQLFKVPPLPSVVLQGTFALSPSAPKPSLSHTFSILHSLHVTLTLSLPVLVLSPFLLFPSVHSTSSCHSFPLLQSSLHPSLCSVPPLLTSFLLPYHLSSLSLLNSHLMSLLSLDVSPFLCSSLLPLPPHSRQLISPLSPPFLGSPQALHIASPPFAAKFLTMKVNYAVIKSVIRKVTVQRDT